MRATPTAHCRSAAAHHRSCWTARAPCHHRHVMVVTTMHTRASAAAGHAQPANTHQPQTDAAVALTAWVQQHSSAWPAQLRAVVDSAGRHRMLAGEPLEPGRLVLSVPEALFMTANSGVASTHCGQLIREAALSEWQALVLHLLCERAAGQGSFWAPYLTTLGQQEQHPLLWPAQVVQQLHGSAMARTLAARRAVVAQDTEVLVAAGANQLPIAAAWRQAQQAAAGAAADRDDGSAASQQQLVSAASVAWASAVLLSRGFALDLSERDLAAEADMSFWGSWAPHGPASLALVPWADACRHSVDAGPEAMLSFDADARVACLVTPTPLASGAEVCDSHGPGRSAADLLLDSGCQAAWFWGVDGAGGDASSSDPHARYDAELTMADLQAAHNKASPRAGGGGAGASTASSSSTSKGGCIGGRNAALLAALGELTGVTPPIVACLSFTPEGPDAMALASARAALASDAELLAAGWRQPAGVVRQGAAGSSGGSKQVAAAAAAARVMGRLSSPLSAATEARVLALLSGLVQAATAAYPTSLQQDEDELRQLLGAGGAAGGDAAAVELRACILRALMSEKAALAGSARVLAHWQRRVADLAAGAAARGDAVKPQQLADVYGDDSDE